MRGRVTARAFGLAGLLLGACVTSGQRGPEVQPVPVFVRGDNLPCEYEAIGPVEAVIRDFGTTEWSFNHARDEALGKAAAEMGADAVLVPDARAGGGEVPFVTVPDEQSRRGVRVEGMAIRWIAGTCSR